MSNIKVSTFPGKIALENCVVPVKLSILYDVQSENDESNAVNFSTDELTEVSNFLRVIAEELAFGNKQYDDGEIRKLNGNHIKFAFHVKKVQSKFGGNLSYLIPSSQKDDDLTFKKISELEYQIEASTYKLFASDDPKKAHQLLNDGASSYQLIKDVPSHDNCSVSKTNNRVENLENLFAIINKSQAEQATTALKEKKLARCIKKIDKVIDEKKNDQNEDFLANSPHTTKNSNSDVKMELSLDDIAKHFKKWKNELVGITKGRVKCQRHEDYVKGGRSRRVLDHQVDVTDFTDTQLDYILMNLKSLFSQSPDNCSPQTVDYICRVMLPEFLTRLKSDITN